MYLHLGHDTVVRTSEIIGIFDIENTSVGQITKDYLSKAHKSVEIINVSMEIPKSFVVCGNGKIGKTREDKKIYITQISPATLLKRANLGKKTNSNIDK